MENTDKKDYSETATTGIVIGIIDILVMIAVITFLCTASFSF
jgi:hypothetical protein